MAYPKEDLVLNCISLGMDIKQSYYAAELSQEEMDALDNDELFQRKASAKQAILERDLLKKLDIAMDKNLEKGNTKELRFKLGAINSKWKNQGGGSTPTAGVVNIFTKDYDMETEETVEISKRKEQDL